MFRFFTDEDVMIHMYVYHTFATVNVRSLVAPKLYPAHPATSLWARFPVEWRFALAQRAGDGLSATSFILQLNIVVGGRCEAAVSSLDIFA